MSRSTIQAELSKLEAALRQSNELTRSQREKIEVLKSINDTITQGYTKSIDILVDMSTLIAKISEFTERVNEQNRSTSMFDENISKAISTQLDDIRNFLASQKEVLTRFGLPQLGGRR